MEKTLIKKINQSEWWHVPPVDPNAYKKRGKFLASTYLQAEFYGRPNNQPENVQIKNPLYGFSELEILIKLFGSKEAEIMSEVINSDTDDWYNIRIEADSKMHHKAKELGYDAIVLMTNSGKLALEKGRKPNSIELNIVM